MLRVGLGSGDVWKRAASIRQMSILRPAHPKRGNKPRCLPRVLRPPSAAADRIRSHESVRMRLGRSGPGKSGSSTAKETMTPRGNISTIRLKRFPVVNDKTQGAQRAVAIEAQRARNPTMTARDAPVPANANPARRARQSPPYAPFAHHQAVACSLISPGRKHRGPATAGPQSTAQGRVRLSGRWRRR